MLTVNCKIATLDENNQVGPPIDKDAVKNYNDALKQVLKEGGTISKEVFSLVMATKAVAMATCNSRS